MGAFFVADAWEGRFDLSGAGCELVLNGTVSDLSLPGSGTPVDRYATGGEFRQQFGHAWRNFEVAGYDDRPFQIFAKFFGANLPLIETLRFWSANLYHGPMSRKCEGGGFVRPRPAQDVVVVSMNQDAYHCSSSLRPC
jgi:hypothetical protein